MVVNTPPMFSTNFAKKWNYDIIYNSTNSTTKWSYKTYKLNLSRMCKEYATTIHYNDLPK
jgi:hypothetical protein